MTFTSDIRVSARVHFAYLMHNTVNCLRYGRGDTEREARLMRLEQAEVLLSELKTWIEKERKELGK
jgi:hypothetical protein